MDSLNTGITRVDACNAAVAAALRDTREVPQQSFCTLVAVTSSQEVYGERWMAQQSVLDFSQNGRGRGYNLLTIRKRFRIPTTPDP